MRILALLCCVFASTLLLAQDNLTADIENDPANLNYGMNTDSDTEFEDEIDLFQFKNDSYERVLGIAKRSKRPILLYFAKESLMQVKQMDETIFQDQKVIDKIYYNFIFIPRYLDSNRRIIQKGSKKVRLEGEVHTDLLKSKFKQKTAPLFLIVDSDGRVYDQLAYSSNSEEFINFLEEGLAAFKKNKMK